MAQVPPEERKPVVEAEKEKRVAEDELGYATAGLDVVDKELGIAARERDQAEAEIEKQKIESELAERSQDAGRSNEAIRARTLAGMQKKVAEAKTEALEGKRTWLVCAREAGRAHLEAARAKIELEKARVAQRKGMRPSDDFDVNDFEAQFHARSAAFDKARERAEDAKRGFDAADSRWKASAEQQKKLLQ